VQTSELLTSITVGEGAVWVGTDGLASAPEIHRIDPESNRDVATIRGTQIGPLYMLLTTGEEGVWAVDASGHLFRVRSRTNAVEEMPSVGSPAAGITLAEGSLWVVTLQGEVVRIDPQEGEIQARMPGGPVVTCTGQCATMIPSVITSMVAGQGIIWVADKTSGAISRVVPASNSTLQPIRIGQTPTGVAVGYESVWVTVDASG
jgi:streptogramin lyase